MAVTVANIIVGAGTLFSKDGSDTTAWSASDEMGATQDGVEISFEPDTADIEVDQLLDAAKVYYQGVNVTLSTTLAEATLENLAMAWGYPSSAVTAATDKTFELGTPSAEPVEYRVKVEGPSTETGATRIYEARRVLSVEGSSHSVSKNDPTVFPVGFRLLPDPSYSGSEYGTIVDSTA